MMVAQIQSQICDQGGGTEVQLSGKQLATGAELHGHLAVAFQMRPSKMSILSTYPSWRGVDLELNSRSCLPKTFEADRVTLLAS